MHSFNEACLDDDTVNQIRCVLVRSPYHQNIGGCVMLKEYVRPTRACQHANMSV